MTVVKRFAKSRTADRRDGVAFNRYRKRMPPASLGFTEELRLYSLDLLKKASVRDAVEVVQQEVDQVERLYLESVGTEPGGDGQCAHTHASDQRKAISLADRLAVARVLLRHLPASPQAMSRGSFATWGSEGHAMVAAVCVAVMLALIAACQRHCRKVICRCPRFASAGALRAQANRRRNSAAGGHKQQPAKPVCSDRLPAVKEPKKSPSQLQQRRSRKTKAVPSAPLGAVSAVVGHAESTGAVQTLGAAGDLKPVKKNTASQTAQTTPDSTPIAQPKRLKAKNGRPPSPQQAATPATNATPQNAAIPAQSAHPAVQQLVQGRQQLAVRQVAQPEAEPEQEQREQQLQGIRVERRVPQAQEVNSAVSEDLRAFAGRKRQLSQPVSDVSEISSVDGDTVSSAGSDAGSVSGQSGSSYGPISPSFVLHHAQQNMSWAQRLRSGMSARAATLAGMDTSDSDTNSISSLDDSYSFRSEASCRRRLSTVGSVDNPDCEDTEDGAGWRGDRARSRAMRPTYGAEVTSSDSESDQDLAARRARASVSSRAKTAWMSAKVAADSTCHCIDEVWDGRLPEGVMAEKLHAADGGVLGRSAALGTIPFELRHPARHYRGLRPCSSWDAGSGPTLSSVMEAEALTSPARPQETVTPAVLTRARSVDENCSLGSQRRPAPVVAPLPFALRTSTAGEAAVAVSPAGGSSPTCTTTPLGGDRRSTRNNRAGAAAILAMIGRKDEDKVTGGGSSSDVAAPPASAPPLAPVQHQFVHVPVAVPVHIPMVPCQCPGWPMAEQRPHPAAAEDRLACRRAIEKQMLFYFSAENMSRDAFLRSNMDADGFVSFGEYSTAAAHHNQVQIRIGCSAWARWLVRS